MEELATDEALVYKSAETQEFLARFAIMHRVSSPYKPHSNQLAEGAVNASKRMLRDNTGAQGTLDTNKFLAALLAVGQQSGGQQAGSRDHYVQQRCDPWQEDQIPHAN